MFDQLHKYKENDNFFLMPKTELESQCNAPKDKSGVFLVVELKNGRIEVVYIGSTELNNSKESSPDQVPNLFDTIVNGYQFGNPRKISYKEKLINEKVDGYDIYWYVTINETIKDSPTMVKDKIFKFYKGIYGKLPRWNRVQP
jgi:hypothetical protein